MLPAANIGKLGFRRWHERQLLEGHVWLATGLICSVAVAALLEAVSFHGPMLERLATLATAFAAGLIACYAFSAYARIMVRAQRLADRSTCPRCGSYARYALVSARSESMSVRCRKCGDEWTIDQSISS
jgi:predicted RNA-binding Zn-ribbon protein involved in translation (DUF1610 family)